MMMDSYSFFSAFNKCLWAEGEGSKHLGDRAGSALGLILWEREGRRERAFEGLFCK